VTVNAARANNADIGVMDTSTIGKAIINMSLIGGNPVARSNVVQGLNTSIVVRDYAWAKRATVSNITSIRFTSTVALAFNIGTKIRIYRG
jgi:hypothetical protein